MRPHDEEHFTGLAMPSDNNAARILDRNSTLRVAQRRRCAAALQL
jgi:hypothetical protein